MGWSLGAARLRLPDRVDACRARGTLSKGETRWSGEQEATLTRPERGRLGHGLRRPRLPRRSGHPGLLVVLGFLALVLLLALLLMLPVAHEPVGFQNSVYRLSCAFMRPAVVPHPRGRPAAAPHRAPRAARPGHPAAGARGRVASVRPPVVLLLRMAFDDRGALTPAGTIDILFEVWGLPTPQRP